MSQGKPMILAEQAASRTAGDYRRRTGVDDLGNWFCGDSRPGCPHTTCFRNCSGHVFVSLASKLITAGGSNPHAHLCIFLLPDFRVWVCLLLSSHDHRLRTQQAGCSFNSDIESSSRLDDDRLGYRAGMGPEAGCSDGDSVISLWVPLCSQVDSE